MRITSRILKNASIGEDGFVRGTVVIHSVAGRIDPKGPPARTVRSAEGMDFTGHEDLKAEMEAKLESLGEGCTPCQRNGIYAEYGRRLSMLKRVDVQGKKDSKSQP